MSIPHNIIDLSERYPFLEESGIAAEYFPAYCNSNTIQHSHNCVEIVIFASGTGTHIVGNKIISVGKGSLAIIHYKQTHTVISSNMEMYNLYIDPDRMIRPRLPPDLQSLFDRYIPLSAGLKHKQNNVHHFHFPGESIPTDILNRMVSETEQKIPGCISALQHLYQLFILDILRSMREIPQKRENMSASDTRIEIIRMYIENHLQEDLSLQRLSGKFGFNKEYLCRRFKEYTGKNLSLYAVSARIQNLLPALLEEKCSIAETALDYGFNDLSYFNRSFKKITGISPSEYIKRKTIDQKK